MQPNLPPQRPAPELEKQGQAVKTRARHQQQANRAGTQPGGAYTAKPSFDGGVSGPQRVKTRRRWLIALLAAAVVGVAAVVVVTKVQKVPPVTHNQKVLVFTDADLDRDATAAAKAALSRGEIPPLLANFPEQTRKEIASGEQGLYTARILDSQAEDGDAVKVTVDEALIGEIGLTNGGAVLTVPLQKGVPRTITYLATRDGGGGVTFGVLSNAGAFRTRVMAVGESERWVVFLK